MKTVTLNFRDARTERPDRSMETLAQIDCGNGRSYFSSLPYSVTHDAFNSHDRDQMESVIDEIIHWIPLKELTDALSELNEIEQDGGAE